MYDNDNQVYGFAALPSVWRDFRKDRFLRFNLSFFEKASNGEMVNEERNKLARLFRYCQVSHIRPQHDEELVITVATERLNNRQRRAVQTLFEQISTTNTQIEFVDVIEPEEASLRYLWYESVRQNLDVENKMIMLIHLGYARTLMVPWDHCKSVNQSAVAPGMLEIDKGIATYAERKGMKRTVGMDEMLLYSQRARRAFEVGQSSVKVVNIELENSVYLDIIEERVSDITNRFKQFLNDSADRMNPIDEILLVGEGTAFQPVVDAMKKIALQVNIPIRTLPQPTYAVARGAASKSWQSKNQNSEVR